MAALHIKEAMNLENSKFFNWVWRLNGLIILASLFIALAFIAYLSISELSRQMPEAHIITNVADDPRGQEKWVLGSSKEFHDSDYIAIPLVSEREEVESDAAAFYSRDSYRYDSRASKNVLFINGKTNDSKWLFPSNDQLINNFGSFPQGYEYIRESNKEIFIFYQVINSDTNNDGVLTKDDKQNLAVSKISGLNYKVIIENVDRIISKDIVGLNDLIIVYQKLGVGYAMKLSATDFKIISNIELPKVGNT